MDFWGHDEKTSLPDELPKEFINYLIVRETGWTLEYIRNLSVRDYIIYSTLSRCKQQIDSEIEAGKLKLAAHSLASIL